MKHNKQVEPILVGEGAQVWPFDLLKKDGDFSVAVIKVSSAGHGATMNTICDRAYYVMNGEGQFKVGEETFDVSTGELVSVPKNSKYDFWATNENGLELLLIQVPTFAPEAEVAF